MEVLLRTWLFQVVLAGCMLLGFGRIADADRPSTPDVLPQSTLAYVSTPDAADFMAGLRRTGWGQLADEPRMKAILTHLYQSVLSAADRLEQQLGFSLEELISLPDGALTLAVTESGFGPPAFVLLIDVRESQRPTAQRFIQGAGNLLKRRGSVASSQPWGDTTLEIFTDTKESGEEEVVVFFELEQTMGIVTNLEEAKGIVDRWQGYESGNELSLAEHEDFRLIRNRWRTTSGGERQMTWFVDPLPLVAAVTRDNLAARAGLAMLPTLGLDAIGAVGGSVDFHVEDLEYLADFHLLLDEPRSGIVNMIALRSIESTPQDWVPADVEGYATFGWNIDQSYSELESLFNRFRGENALSKSLQGRLNKQLGVDVEADILDQLGGRFSYLSWIEPSARFNSQVHLLAVRLKDPAAFAETLDRIAEQNANRLTKKSFSGVHIYLGEPRDPPRRGRRNRRSREDQDAPLEDGQDVLAARKLQSCILILGNELLMTDNEMLVEHLIITRGDVEFRLADESDWKKVFAQIKTLAGNDKPRLVTFRQPEKTLERFYEFLRSGETRQYLREQSESNAMFRMVTAALDANPLPPLEQWVRFLSPGGALLIDDEEGLHYQVFSLRTAD